MRNPSRCPFRAPPVSACRLDSRRRQPATRGLEVRGGRPPALAHLLRRRSEGRRGRRSSVSEGAAPGGRVTICPALFGPGERLRGSDAVMAAYLNDPSRVGLAHLGVTCGQTWCSTQAPFGLAMRPGAAVDRRLYTHRRELAAAPSPGRSGAAPPERGRGFGGARRSRDVRVVDAGGRQWPIWSAIVRPRRNGISGSKEKRMTSAFLTTAFGSQRRQFGSRP